MEKASLDGAFFHYKIDYYYLSGTMQDALLYLYPSMMNPFSLLKERYRGHEGNHPWNGLFPIVP